MVLMADEKTLASKKFNEYDLDGNGSLDSEELGEIMIWLHDLTCKGKRRLSEEEKAYERNALQQSILAACDDGDGELSFEEFWSWRERYVYLERRQNRIRAMANQDSAAGAIRKSDGGGCDVACVIS